MEKKRITLIIAIIAIVVLASGITFALLVRNLEGETKLDLEVAGLKINYLKGTDIIGGTLSPTLNRLEEGSLSTEVELWKDTTDNLYGTIYLNVNTIGNNLKSDALNWEVWKGDTRLNFGTFTNINSGDIVKLTDAFSLSSDKTLYTVYVWLDDNLANSSMNGESFSGSISVTATNEAPNGN